MPTKLMTSADKVFMETETGSRRLEETVAESDPQRTGKSTTLMAYVMAGWGSRQTCFALLINDYVTTFQHIFLS